METNDVKRLALILAVQAEVEGMKVENSNREQQDWPPVYSNEDFRVKAEELKNLAYTHDEQLFG